VQKTIQRAVLCSVLLTKCHSGDQVKYHLEDLDLDGSIILKWISKNWDVAAWTELLWLKIMTGRTAHVNAAMIIQVP